MSNQRYQTTVSCNKYELSRVRQRCAVRISWSDFDSLEVGRKYPRAFWTMLTTQAFLSVDDFTHECFSLSLDYYRIVFQLLSWRIGPRSRTLVGCGELQLRLLRSSPAVFEIQTFEISQAVVASSQNDKATTQQNSEKIAYGPENS